MTDFDSLYKEINSIILVVKQQRSVQIGSLVIKKRLKKLIFDYFNYLQPNLLFDVQEIDAIMQELIILTNKNASKNSYLNKLKKLKRLLDGIELQVKTTRGDNNKNDSRQDPFNELVVKTLTEVCLPAAVSYRQALEDINMERLSYRGTSVELREVLREILDQLATDEDLKTAGFKIEKDQRNYTMKQKVRYILKYRETSVSKLEAPENATLIVDEGIARLTRATYDRSSQSTHSISLEKREILLLKKYLDVVLCELLEIPMA